MCDNLQLQLKYQTKENEIDNLFFFSCLHELQPQFFLLFFNPALS